MPVATGHLEEEVASAPVLEVFRTESPFQREDSSSWRSRGDEALSSSASPGLKPCQSCPALAIALGPPCAFALAARTSNCWLLSIPGLIWLCLPLCMWTAWEIHKLWKYWDGRVQFTEDWPAIQLVRTFCIVLLFAVSLGTAVFAFGCGVWGFREWDAQGSCPY
eukprot:TRINITY_DN85064_c0_g1_i1.p2 TRINITY_DN85064_c0_g1~~TRINITY_DN85064_c0_g1_i1.p2  ORF type:complete len:164 (+),score=13.73 TRINITY_DN85064_c0_g1_i1:52-543(+)